MMKPMSLAYSRKQRRHRSRPYLRMIPWVLLHTRLPQHSTQQQSAPRDEMALHSLDRTAQLCPTTMVVAAAQQRTPQLTPGAAAHTPATHRLRCQWPLTPQAWWYCASAAMFDSGRSPVAAASRVVLRVGVVSIRHLRQEGCQGKQGAQAQREQDGANAN